MDAPSDNRQPSSGSWVDLLVLARADVAAGRVHDMEDVLRDLDDDCAELEKAQSDAGVAGDDVLAQAPGGRPVR